MELARKHRNLDEIVHSDNKQKTIWSQINRETGWEKLSYHFDGPTSSILNYFFATIGTHLNDKLPDTQCSAAQLVKKVPINGDTMFLTPTIVEEVL